jgi:hypothetical protein
MHKQFLFAKKIHYCNFLRLYCLHSLTGIWRMKILSCSILFHKPSFFYNYLWRRDELEPERRDGSSLCDVVHDGVLCTFSIRTALDRGKWCRPSGQASWPSIVYKVTPCQPGRPPRWASPLAFGLIGWNSTCTFILNCCVSVISVTIGYNLLFIFWYYLTLNYFLSDIINSFSVGQSCCTPEGHSCCVYVGPVLFSFMQLYYVPVGY